MIAITFECGHTGQFSGDEQRPVCSCGNDRMTTVLAPAPRFRGHALGPCAKHEGLPAVKVDLKSGTVVEE